MWIGGKTSRDMGIVTVSWRNKADEIKEESTSYYIRLGETFRSRKQTGSLLEQCDCGRLSGAHR